MFRGFDGVVSRWHPEKIIPTGKFMPYHQILRSCIFKLVSTATDVTVSEVQKVFGTQSLRSGGATVAARKVSFEVWKAHGAWETDLVPLRYVGNATGERLQTTAGLVEYQQEARKAKGKKPL